MVEFVNSVKLKHTFQELGHNSNQEVLCFPPPAAALNVNLFPSCLLCLVHGGIVTVAQPPNIVSFGQAALVHPALYSRHPSQ